MTGEIPPHNTDGAKQPTALVRYPQNAIDFDYSQDAELVAAMRAFGLRLESADETTKRRVKVVLNELVDDPANHATLTPMLKAALGSNAREPPTKRRLPEISDTKINKTA